MSLVQFTDENGDQVWTARGSRAHRQHLAAQRAKEAALAKEEVEDANAREDFPRPSPRRAKAADSAGADENRPADSQ